MSNTGSPRSLPAVKLLAGCVVVLIALLGAWRVLSPPPPPVGLHDSAARALPIAATREAASQVPRHTSAVSMPPAPNLVSATQPHPPGATETVVFGVVRDEERDTPIAGARVLGVSTGPRSTSSETRSDGAGNYRLCLPYCTPDPLNVCAFARGYARYAAKITPRPGAEQRHDPRLAPGCRLTVRVVDETGAPVEGAAVSMNAPERFFWSPFAPTTTDAEGRVELTDLDLNGDRLVVAKKAGYTDSEHVYVIGFTSTGSREEVVLTLHTRHQVEGCIIGQVVDARGRPVEGARVSWDRPRDGARAETTSNGSGEYQLRLKLDDPVDTSTRGFVAAYKPGYGAVGSFEPTPTAGQPAGLDFRLEPAHRLSGQVVDTSGQPVSGVSVSTRSVEGVPLPHPQATTDERGRFHFDDVSSGTTVLTVGSSGFLGSTRIIDQEVNVNGDVRVVLPSFPLRMVLTGRVFDEATGQPVKEFTIDHQAFYDEQGDFCVPLDSVFRMYGIGDPFFIFRVAARGYAETEVNSALLQRNDADEILVPMVRLEPVRVRLVDADSGEPLSGATVLLAQPSEREAGGRVLVWAPTRREYAGSYQRATTDAAGECVLRDASARQGLARQRYLYAWPEGHAPIMISPWERASLVDSGGVAVIPVPRGSRITGTLMKNDGPVAKWGVALHYVLVHLVSAKVEPSIVRPVIRRTTTDPEGRFAFTGLPEGTFVVSTDTPGEASPPTELQVALGTDELKTVKLSP